MYKKLKFKLSYLILILIFLFGFVFAHNPRIVWDINSSPDVPILVKYPEISQAFYGQLKGKPDFYKIVSDKDFILYLSITVPAMSGSDQDYGMIIKDNSGNLIDNIDSNNLKRKKFYEKFAGDLYYQGPGFEKKVNSGIYYVQIYSSDNIGKYVLAIGKLEIWPINEVWNTFKNLPSLKTYFFEKPIITMFFNYIGISLFVLILFIVLIILLINKLTKKFKS